MSQEQANDPKTIIKNTINRLKEEGVYAGFPQGQQVPNFSLKNHNGEQREIYDVIKQNKFVIINFFRGDWCGYCKSELEELEENYNNFKELDAEVISIAPQNPDTLSKLKDKKELSFDLLSDPDLSTAKMFNLVWEIPIDIREIYLEEYDLNIPELNANNSWHLPVPATYIINKVGNVVAKYENLNYSQRMDVEKILDIIQNYKEE